ncbi:MAG: bacteriorhodopsin-like [Bdellovibrionota bacterium]|jgi:bacteriorhodopsin
MELYDYTLIYNAFSFCIAVMGAATVFLFLGRSQVAPQYKTAVTISGIVTLIAFYHYWRILESWDAAYSVSNGVVTATGVAFNDAYRYVDWLLTVPLLLLELILVMRLSREETFAKGKSLATAAALMIILGYPGEISADHAVRWKWWALSMLPFLYIVYQLMSGLAKSINSQPESVRELVGHARLITLVTWCFYPIVFIFPMLNVEGADTFVQVGYTIADILAKAGFGVFIWVIAMRKSEANA